VRSLGIDLGDRRTGVALSDPLGVTCRPLDVIDECNEARLIERIVELARSFEAAEIVVGLPRPLSGGSNRQLERVLAFVTALEVQTGMMVKTWDERFTSKLAGPAGTRTGARDAVAACYMLQNYLDAHAHSHTHDRGV
jgi:putative Holliday junction resolvase